MNLILSGMILAGLLIGSVAAEPQFKIDPFDRDQIPRIDGDAGDWAMVPESYAVDWLIQGDAAPNGRFSYRYQLSGK